MYKIENELKRETCGVYPKNNEIGERTAYFTVTVKERNLFATDNFSSLYAFTTAITADAEENDSARSSTRTPKKSSIPWYRSPDFDKIAGKSAASMYGLNPLDVDYSAKISPPTSSDPIDSLDMDSLDDDELYLDFDDDIEYIIDDDGDFDDYEYDEDDDDLFYDSDYPHRSEGNLLAETAPRGGDGGDIMAWMSDGGKYGRAADGILSWANGSFELKTQGKIKFSGSHIEFVYDESEITGQRDSLRRILFDTNRPDMVIMCQQRPKNHDSVSNMVYTIEKGKRHYTGDILQHGGSAAVYALGDKFVNTLGKNGGKFYAEYITEYNGSRRNSVTYSLTAVII